MLVDLEAVDGSRRYRSRICVIGGGIAGLTLAQNLCDSGLSVHLLETGGLQDEGNQDLNAVTNAGAPHRGGTQGRFRILGGASTRWGGQLLPFTDDVLRPGAHSELPVWPVNLSDIDRFYGAVEAALGTNHKPYTSELLREYRQAEPFASDNVRLRYSKWAPSQRRNLARTLGRTCAAAKAVTVFLHANVTRLQMQWSAKAVQSALVKTRAGVVHHFEADLFVLCTGTIEASRLLLASNDVCAAGIGNQHDQVGRYFHDHLSVRAGSLVAARKSVLQHFTPRVSWGTMHTPKLEATAELRKRENLLSVMAHFPIEEPAGSALRGARSALSCLQREGLDREACATLLRMSAQAVRLMPWFWSVYARRQRPISREATVSLQIDVEQKPQAQSRIWLSRTRDRLGCQIPVVEWRVSGDERRTVQTYARVIDGLFRRKGWGQIEWNVELWQEDDAWLGLSSDSFHMMGGTRMGVSAARSVVNGDLKVHGVGNLYVASCSVFPTGGSSNPTLTLMALTLRLAERMRTELQRAPSAESGMVAELAASI